MGNKPSVELTLEWQRWSLVPSPKKPGLLLSIAAISANDAGCGLIPVPAAKPRCALGWRSMSMPTSIQGHQPATSAGGRQSLWVTMAAGHAG